MTRPPLRLLLAVAAVAGVLPAGIAAGAGTALRLDRGVVQSVSTTQIELRALDGSLLPLALGPATRVRLNGRPATTAQIRPGFVAEVLHRGSRAATVVRAFGKVPLLVERGLVTALSPTAITVQPAGGTPVTVPLDGSTRFRHQGVTVGRFAARPGARVAVRHADGGTARVVTILKRAQA